MMISPSVGKTNGQGDGGRNRFRLLTPLLGLITFAVSAGFAPPQADALDDEELTFLHQINDYRAQHGLGQLTLSDGLDDVARWMANDMASHNYFSHEDSLGRDPFQRMAGLGYKAWLGENLAAGAEGSAAAFQVWQESPPHSENMLGPRYTTIGIARAYSMSSAHGWYWVTDFAGDAQPPSLAPVAMPEPASETQTAPPSPSPPDAVAAPLLDAQPAAPPATDYAVDQTPVQVVRPTYRTHSGLLIEGLQPMDFGPRTRGTFLSALLDFATAFRRSATEPSVRV